jgi:hypothetical protein
MSVRIDLFQFWMFLHLISVVVPARGADIGTSFTYQGRLVKDGTPVTSSPPHCNFTFDLWDADVGGNQVGNSPQIVTGVEVNNGLFAASLDFGPAAIDGTARWLEITVDCGMPGDPTLLTPRQPLAPTPHALALPGLYTRQNPTSPNLIGGTVANFVAAGAVGATIAGGGYKGLVPAKGGGTILIENENIVFDDFGVIGGGRNNVAGCDDGDVANEKGATVSGGYDNVASGSHSTVGGGLNSTASAVRSTVGGGQSNTAGGDSASVSGGSQNSATDNWSSVGGGQNNSAGGEGASIAGGIGNSASAVGAVVSGGRNNSAGGLQGPVVGGGDFNTASGLNASIVGGYSNSASGAYDSVGGGFDNVAGGYAATIPGGHSNSADGDYSLAAGRRAKAVHRGAYVWADSTNADFTSTGTEQFLIRAAGGVGIGTSSPDSALDVSFSGFNGISVNGDDTGDARIRITNGTSAHYIFDDDDGGHALKIESSLGRDVVVNTNGASERMRITSGGQVGIARSNPSFPLHVGTNSTNGNGAHVTNGGTWVNGSDRNSKKNFSPIDRKSILAKLATMTITSWQYKGEADSVQHIGPVAQDFHAAFGLGHDARYITTIDADGVALAAIQGLHQIVREKECKIELLESDISNLKSQISGFRGMEARLARLEAMLQGTPTKGEKP